jgi:hypothetical protein
MEVTHTRQLEVSWKNTFNSNLKMHGITNAFKNARDNGYPFVAWNGFIYDVNSNATEIDRIIEVDKLPA